jgi:hypothetical protein
LSGDYDFEREFKSRAAAAAKLLARVIDGELMAYQKRGDPDPSAALQWAG